MGPGLVREGLAGFQLRGYIPKIRAYMYDSLAATALFIWWRKTSWLKPACQNSPKTWPARRSIALTLFLEDPCPIIRRTTTITTVLLCNRLLIWFEIFSAGKLCLFTSDQTVKPKAMNRHGWRLYRQESSSRRWQAPIKELSVHLSPYSWTKEK